MASAIRFKAATGLLSLSRAAPKIQQSQRIGTLKHSAMLCQRGAFDTQRRLFSCSTPLRADIIVVVPQMAESISEGTLSSLPKKVGERIEADEEIASIETDKIDIAVNAPEDAVIAEYFAAEGDTVVVGQDLARLVTGGDAGAVKKPEGEEKPGGEEAAAPQEETKATESTKPQAEAEKPAPEAPKPEAPAPAPAPAAKPAAQPAQPQPVASTSAGPSRGERVEKMTRMRKTIASRLKQSQNTCASLTTIQEVDMTNLMAWRARYRDEVAEEHGVRLGYMGAFTKATTMALQKVPQINAAIDTEKEIITYRDYVDISIAVSAPKGLVTPVLRNTHTLSIVELEREVASLAKKARDGKLTLEDLEGGNMSISNPGIFGSMFGTPLINYPQAAVFNMNGIQQRVMAINGQAEIRPMMYISLTYDHRLIDGREAVTYLNLVKKYIEDPSRMLLVPDFTGSPAKYQGLWPSFWTKRLSNRNGTGWIDCGEWGILEVANTMSNSNRIQGTLHSRYLDGKEFYGVTGEMVGALEQWKQLAWQPYFMILQVAVGGLYADFPTDSTISGCYASMPALYTAIRKSD